MTSNIIPIILQIGTIATGVTFILTVLVGICLCLLDKEAKGVKAIKLSTIPCFMFAVFLFFLI